jgi:hypothetical protein
MAKISGGEIPFQFYYSFFVVTWVRSTFNNESANLEPRAGVDLTLLRVRRGFHVSDKGLCTSRNTIYLWFSSFIPVIIGCTNPTSASKFRCPKYVGAIRILEK